jgi:sporulation protein YlmC with PRC-barrel domain
MSTIQLKRVLLGAGAVALVMAAIPVVAGAEDTTAGAGQGVSVTPLAAASSEIDANKLIGRNIKNPQGDTVGEINSVAIDKDGKVRSVIVGVGGFLGVGEKNVALPWDSLTVSKSGEDVVANVTKDELKALPEHKFPESAHSGMVYSYEDEVRANPPVASNAPAATSPEATTAPAAGTPGDLPASKLVGATVKNMEGKSVGKVGEVLLTSSGSVQGVIVDVGGFLGIGAHPVLIGWSDLTIKHEKGTVEATTGMTREQLDKLPTFKESTVE